MPERYNALGFFIIAILIVFLAGMITFGPSHGPASDRPATRDGAEPQ